jgi:hypothetical protein
MNEQHAYVASASDALTIVAMAMREAEESLPEHVRKQHWSAAKHSPNAWDSVKHWHAAQDVWDPETADILTHLVLLSGALANLRSVLVGNDDGQREPDLKLAKMRRTA